MQTFGKKGTQPLNVVAKNYHRMLQDGGAEKELVEAMGRAATTTGRAYPAKAGASIFGAKGRDAKRQQTRNLRVAMGITTRGMEKEESALVVGQRLSYIGADIPTCLTVARSVLREHSLREKAKEDAMDRQLAEFATGRGADQLQALQRAIPGLPTTGLVLVPSTSGMSFVCLPAQGDAVAKAVGWAHRSKKTNTSAGMRASWEAQHRTLMEDDCPPVGTPPPRPSVCRSAGVCLCSPDGRALRAMKAGLLRNMKNVFQKESDNKRELLAGRAIVKLAGRPADGDIDAYLELDDPVRHVFLQVGMMYLSPYQPSFLVVEECGTPAAPNAAAEQIVIKAPEGALAEGRSRS